MTAKFLALTCLLFAASARSQDCTAYAYRSACGGTGQCTTQGAGTCIDGDCGACASCCDIYGNCTIIHCDRCQPTQSPAAFVGLSSIGLVTAHPEKATLLIGTPPPCVLPLEASIKLVTYSTGQGSQGQRLEVLDTGTALSVSNLKGVASPHRVEISGFTLANNGARPLEAYKVSFQVHSAATDEPMEMESSSDLTWVGPSAFIPPGVRRM